MPSACGGRERTEGTLAPGKVLQNCAPPGRGVPSARRRGGGQLPSTRLRGEQGEAPSKGCRGEKPHDTTQHHTHSRPPQTAPQHTNHRHTDTPHGTSPHQEPQNTTPDITPRTTPTEALLPKTRHFPPGRCILLERGHPFIPKCRRTSLHRYSRSQHVSPTAPTRHQKHTLSQTLLVA